MQLDAYVGLTSSFFSGRAFDWLPSQSVGTDRPPPESNFGGTACGRHRPGAGSWFGAYLVHDLNLRNGLIHEAERRHLSQLEPSAQHQLAGVPRGLQTIAAQLADVLPMPP